MSAKVHLCDKCGNVSYEINLSETCYGQELCEECMVEFLNEQECER